MIKKDFAVSRRQNDQRCRTGHEKGGPMNQADIETFLMLVKTRNITKTAENLYVSQPTVSHRLQLLEQELNTPLLIRRKGFKKVELTQKGEEFIPIAQRWLALMQETISLQYLPNEMHLNIGCTNTLNSSVFLDLYRQILKDPDLNLKHSISTHYSYEIYELLENHSIDIGFVYHQLHYKNIIGQPLMREKMFIVQEMTGAVKKQKLHISELDFDKEICFFWEANFQIWHEQMVTKGRRNNLEVDIYTLLEAFLEEEGRWTIAPLFVTRQLQQQKKVFVSEIADRRQPPERITYMIRHKDTTASKAEALDLFDRKMREYMKNSGFLAEGSQLS